jgi:hypothetical protein
VDVQQKITAEGVNEEQVNKDWEMMARVIKFRTRRKVHPKEYQGQELPEEPKKITYYQETRFTEAARK